MSLARLSWTWVFWLMFLLGAAGLFIWWGYAEKDTAIVVYFGRPSDIWNYTAQHWKSVLRGCAITTLIALVSLFISGALAVVFLAIGLLSERGLLLTGRLAAVSQTIPMLVVVLISYIVGESLVKGMGLDLSFVWYCFVPVSVALFFPPLAYGIKGVRDINSTMKGLLRIWNAPQGWRIRHVFLPGALPHILTGLRVSSTWAVAATLITEGLVFGVGSDDKCSIGHWLMTPFSTTPVAGQTPTLLIVVTLLGFAVYCLMGLVEWFTLTRFLGIAAKKEREYPIAG